MEKADAIKIAELYKTPRFREIERLERYIDGTIYDDRPNFFVDDGTPLLERKPCCRYPIAQIAIRSHADMVLGEGKWPRIKLCANKRDELSDETKKAVESLLGAIVEQAELRARLREELEIAMGARAAVIVGHVKRGCLGVQVFSAKACHLEQDASGCATSLTIEYPYLEEYKANDGKWTWRCMLYRREIDAEWDKVYEPVEATQDGTARPSSVDKKKSTNHKLGFCPVEWYAFLPPSGHDDGLNGHSLHERQLSELELLNIGLSQRARAAHLAGDPQMYETGVSKDEKPAPTGRGISQVILDDRGQPYGALGSAFGGIGGARKRGVGYVWRYNDPTAKLDQVTLPGDALKSLDEHCQDLARKIGRAMSYVELEPDKIHGGGKSSGRSLEILLKPQLDFDGRVREDFGEHGLVAALNLMLRIAFTVNRARQGSVYLDGLDELMTTIESFERQIEGEESKAWMPPALDLEWGPFFIDTSSDTIKDKADAAIEAKDGKIISKRTATASIAHAFGIDDVDEELAQIETETAADAAKQAAAGGQQPLVQGMSGADASTPANTPAPPNKDDAQPKTPNAPPTSPAPSKDGVAPANSAPAVKDPGGVASAKLARNIAESPPRGIDAAQAHTQTISPDAHLRASGVQPPAFNAGVAETVYQLLKSDYPDDAIDWIRDPQIVQSIEGPKLVPLEQIDFTNQDNWAARDEDISSYVDKIGAGKLKPIVLVNEPNDEKFMIVDGHHRGLSYEKLGKPAMAYVIHTNAVGGPWDAMHSSQKNENGDPVLTSKQKA